MLTEALMTGVGHSSLMQCFKASVVMSCRCWSSLITMSVIAQIFWTHKMHVKIPVIIMIAQILARYSIWVVWYVI